MKFTLREIAALAGGEVTHGEPAVVEVVGASTDSRTLVAGQLFVPLTASRDGHDFIADAAAAGAAASLVGSDRRGLGAAAGLAEVVVDDPPGGSLEAGRRRSAADERPSGGHYGFGGQDLHQGHAGFGDRRWTLRGIQPSIF